MVLVHIQPHRAFYFPSSAPSVDSQNAIYRPAHARLHFHFGRRFPWKLDKCFLMLPLHQFSNHRSFPVFPVASGACNINADQISVGTTNIETLYAWFAFCAEVCSRRVHFFITLRMPASIIERYAHTFASTWHLRDESWFTVIIYS